MLLPKYLTDFLNALLGRESAKSPPPSRIDRLIAKDCMYAITTGRQKPAKHILLPWVVKMLTGNVELMKILNRLVHGILYTQMKEIYTALCLQKLAATDEEDIALPGDILYCIPTT